MSKLWEAFDGDGGWTVIISDQITAAKYMPRHINGPVLRLTMASGASVDASIGEHATSQALHTSVTQAMSGLGSDPKAN